MLNSLHTLFLSVPLLALFLTITLGYLVGKIKLGRFVVGGIAGTLIIGVLIGQIGIQLPEGIGSIFFALFIYAVGYQGGPQFFQSLNKDTILQLLSAIITCVLGLLCVLFFAYYFHLDRGTAAGLAAGGLTQSAMIGTANDAIGKLAISADIVHQLKSNVAVGYAVCYIFGSLGPILLLAAIFPMFMGWDLRSEAIKLAKQSKSSESLEPGQFNAVKTIDTRIYLTTQDSVILNKKISNIIAQYSGLSIDKIIRDGSEIDLQTDPNIQLQDILIITGQRYQLIKAANQLGSEIESSDKVSCIEEVKRVILTNKDFENITISNWYKSNKHNGTFITGVYRMGELLSPSADLVLKRGDEIILLGKANSLDKISHAFGKALASLDMTDFIFFGLGMSLGIGIGLISFKIFSIKITLGAGVGCLFSGLLFGYLRATHHRYAQLPTGASNYLRDFGLAVFVAVTGIEAGPQAINTIKQYGLELFALGVGVTIIPQIISFFISYYLLRIKNPIILLSTIAGGRSANPAFAALLEKSGNATPVVPFTASYAIANILLTLWGPIIIGLININ